MPPRPRAVLIARTPYGAARFSAEAAGWCAHGIGLIAQDVRGRHESPGVFEPYVEHRLDDGPALLAWARSRIDAPLILLGTSYGAHAALAAAEHVRPDGVVVAVPALGLGETARTRGGVLQLASRLGWWLAHDVRRPWSEVLQARRHDARRAATVAGWDCPMLAIGGTDDYFAHDLVDLWSAWGGPAALVLGPWGHDLAGAGRARRILTWSDAVLAGRAPSGVETIDHAGSLGRRRPPMAVVRIDAAEHEQWCASLRVAGREVAHGAAFGDTITLGPVLLDPGQSFDVVLARDDFPRYARSHRAGTPVPDHHLEFVA